MRAYVFTDKGLERYAGRFVWLSVDTENAKNADFLTKYPKIDAIFAIERPAELAYRIGANPCVGRVLAGRVD